MRPRRRFDFYSMPAPMALALAAFSFGLWAALVAAFPPF